jgi:hypothetical protein
MADESKFDEWRLGFGLGSAAGCLHLPELREENV